MAPKRSSVSAYIRSTSASSATFARVANASPGPVQSETVSCASLASTSAAQTLAPSAVKTIAASRPMPPPAPVMTQTFPSSLPAMSALRGDEHALDLGITVQRVHPELAAESGLLEAAERSLDAHRGVRVHRENACIDRARHTERARDRLVRLLHPGLLELRNRLPGRRIEDGERHARRSAR